MAGPLDLELIEREWGEPPYKTASPLYAQLAHFKELLVKWEGGVEGDQLVALAATQK